MEAGYEEEPEEAVPPKAVAIKETGPPIVSEDAEEVNKEDDEEYEGDDQIAERHLRTQVQLVNLHARSKFSGPIVTLEYWCRDNQLYEARFYNTKTVIKVGLENLH